MKKEELLWKMKLAYTVVKYDVKNCALAIRLAVIRMRVALAKKAVEVLKDEL